MLPGAGALPIKPEALSVAMSCGHYLGIEAHINRTLERLCEEFYCSTPGLREWGLMLTRQLLECPTYI